MTNNKKTDSDIRMMNVFAYANFNFSNMKRTFVNMEDAMTKIHDDILGQAYQKNNNLSEMELEELKKYLYG